MMTGLMKFSGKIFKINRKNKNKGKRVNMKKDMKRLRRRKIIRRRLMIGT